MTQRQSQVNVSSSLLTINRFAQVCRTTPRTVRFYDQKGLLKPAKVDEWTKYRYYHPKQARDFLKIRFMQNFRIPLSQIKLNLQLGAENQFLEERLTSLQKEIEERQKELMFLDRLNRIFFEELKLGQVFEKEEIGPFNVFCLRVEHGSYDSINKYRQEIRKKAEELGLDVAERDIVLYFDSEYKPKDTRLEISLISKKDYSKGKFDLAQPYYFRTFPKTKALVYNYQGLNTYFILVYQRLFDYLIKYKVKLKGDNFDINMEDPFVQKSPYDYRTKLVFPV